MIGTGADIDIVVTCMNDGEDSFGSQVLIKLPDGVDFNKMTKLQAVSPYLHVYATFSYGVLTNKASALTLLDRSRNLLNFDASVDTDTDTWCVWCNFAFLPSVNDGFNA